MEIQLDELIQKIKNEGVQSAEQEAQKIESEAREKAAATVSQANKEAQQIVAEAQQKAVRAEQAGKDALAQAARDLILNVQASLKSLFLGIINDAVRESFDGSALESVIVALVAASKGEEVANLSVQVPQKDLDRLEKGLRDKLAASVEKGLTIEPAPGLESGFRLATKGGGAYYDFSADSIAAILSGYVSPRLAEHLRSVSKAE